MSDSKTPLPPHSPDETLITSPKADVPTHSSLNPIENTSSEAIRSAAPTSVIVDVGSQLGPYQLVAKLGEGGMGAVFKARHIKLGKLVALKILPPHVMSRGDALARFEREMLAVGSLQHPNIVQAHDAGDVGGVHYLSMEFVEGQDLQKLLQKKGPMSVVNACKAIRQAAQGLAAAHKLGLVHRDIKPSNLFVTKQTGQIKILDMGLALLSQDQVPAALTSTGQCFGTPDYMAPEQWSDAHSCDARADLYSLGCTLFYLLVGKPPYPTETHRSAANKMKGHVMDPAPDLRAARPDVPEELDAIYRKLLAKSPKDRFDSAQELADALAPFSTSKGTTTFRDGGSIATSEFLSANAGGTDVTRDLVTPHATSDPFSATSTWTPGTHATASLSNTPAYSAASRQRRLLAIGGAAMLLIVGVILTITNRKGTSATVTLQENSKPATSNDVTLPKTGWQGWPADAPPPAIAPFSAEQANEHQKAWAAHLKVPVEYTNALGMKFRLIPPGEFLMGSTPEELEAAARDFGETKDWQDAVSSEVPKHKVLLTQPFYLGTHEVTQGEYEKVMGANPSYFSPTGMGKDAIAGMETIDHPVETVNWLEAVDFCTRISQQLKLKPFYVRADDTVTTLKGNGYRLPTEAEWEFACRAGTTSQFWTGNTFTELLSAGWSSQNAGARTHAVGELQSNPFGLFDIHGNVWEWVHDASDRRQYEQFVDTPAVDPRGQSPTLPSRILRGGCWLDGGNVTEFFFRSAFRRFYESKARSQYFGFRVALSAEAVRQELQANGAAAKVTATVPITPPGDSENLPATFTNPLGMKFVRVPKGSGWLGGRGGAPGDKSCLIEHDFYLGTYSVTQGEWELLMGNNPSQFSRLGSKSEAVRDISDQDLKRFPVESVSWDNAESFVQRLNSQDQQPGWAYRLPTEVEWEYACRGGPIDRSESTFDYYLDTPSNALLPTQANFGLGDDGRPCTVGSYKPNPLGLHDMHGNVHVWCADLIPSPDRSQADSHRVLRGGSYWSEAPFCRATTRFVHLPSQKQSNAGLRVARVRVETAIPSRQRHDR